MNPETIDASQASRTPLDGIFQHPARDTRDWRDRRDSRVRGPKFEVSGTSNRAFPKQGHNSEADPRFTFHASRFTDRWAAFRTREGFFCRFTFLGGQGEELFALPAGANFEVGGSLIVDVGGQE